jgi:DNA-binding transcriptional regulator YdaS (Cro superfamily)
MSTSWRVAMRGRLKLAQERGVPIERADRELTPEQVRAKYRDVRPDDLLAAERRVRQAAIRKLVPDE